MGNKNVKFAALAVMGGAVMQFGGCLSGETLQRVIFVSAVQQTWEFLLDNDAVFDLFESGNVAQ